MRRATARGIPPKVIKRYRNKYVSGFLCQAEALEFLRSLKAEAASIIFLDPPFNLGKQYSRRQRALDRKPEQDYYQWLKDVVSESSRILGKGGALYLYHLPIWAMRIGAELSNSLVFRHWIAVSMKNGFVRGRRLYPAHYALLMFSKGRVHHFSRPRVPLAECRHCGEYIKDYGGYLKIVEGRGVNLSDVWDDLSPVRHANRKNRAANELPALLFHRIVQMSGHVGGLYVDPFIGSGTGILAAARRGMRFAGCDLLKANCEVVRDRLEKLCREKENT